MLFMAIMALFGHEGDHRSALPQRYASGGKILGEKATAMIATRLHITTMRNMASYLVDLRAMGFLPS